MSDLPTLVALSAVMGFSIFLSMPIVLRKSYGSRTVTLLNATAIGILLFLLADLFLDVGPTIYGSSSNAYVANPTFAVTFVLAVATCFVVLFVAEHRSRGSALPPTGMALVVALAIGFQNLTEGLVFGASWAAGAVGLSVVVFVGFFLQNITEGFPITAPLLGRTDGRTGLIALFFLVGGVPTLIGGIGGYFYNSAMLDLVFASFAIGAILYSVLPMLRVAFRPAEPPATTYMKQRLTYLGVLLGFLIGFIVNAL